jgi:bacteriorhodopsin
MPRRRMRGGEGEFGMGNLVQDAALIGTGAYLARQNPNSSVLGVVGTAVKYFAYFTIGIILFFVIFFIIVMIFGKKTEPPPIDSTNAASGTPPPKK